MSSVKYEPLHTTPTHHHTRLSAGTYSTVHSTTPGWCFKQHIPITDPEEFTHILGEISAHRIAAQHGCAPPLGRIWVEEARVCCEMEQGTPLHKFMHKVSPTRRSEFLAHIFAQCATLLQTLHKISITHGDIYLDNVLLMPDNSIKITDYGLASRWTVSMPVPVEENEAQKQPARCHLVARGKRKGNYYAGDFFALLCLPVIFLSKSHTPWSLNPADGTVDEAAWNTTTALLKTQKLSNLELDIVNTCHKLATQTILPVKFPHAQSQWLTQTLIPQHLRENVPTPASNKQYIQPATPQQWRDIKQQRVNYFRQHVNILDNIFIWMHRKPHLRNVQLHPYCSSKLPWRFLVWLDTRLYPRILRSYPFPRIAVDIVQAIALITSLFGHKMNRCHREALHLVVQKGDAPNLIADCASALLANQDAPE